MYEVKRDLLDFLYNRMLPSAYISEDSAIGSPFKRYLSALVEGGIEPLLKDTLDIMNLRDPQKCPSKYLPVLCENFGLPYFPDIDEKFQRKFLSNFMELNMRKGTSSCIEYLARELSGYDVEVDSSDSDLVIVRMNTYEDDPKILTNQSVIEKYAVNFIPACMELLVVTSYYYTEEADFISLSTDELYPPSITTNTDYIPQPTIGCLESFKSAIISSLGTEEGFQGVIEDVSSLSNEIKSTPEWFTSNCYNSMDIITASGSETVRFN